MVARNLRTPLGEVDLVLERGQHLVVCEVKTRRGSWAVEVSPGQKERLERASVWVLARYGTEDSVLSVDLVCVELRRYWPRVRRFRNFIEVGEVWGDS